MIITYWVITRNMNSCFCCNEASTRRTAAAAIQTDIRNRLIQEPTNMNKKVYAFLQLFTNAQPI